MGLTEEGYKAEFGDGGKGDRRHINTDRLRRGKKDTKVVIDNFDGGHEGVSGDNGVKESIDGGKSGCVGPDFILYVYPVSPLSPT
jgi:hypothetical protein